MTTMTKTTPIITTWFSFFTKNEGRAIPTLNDELPYGFPYFRQFYFAFSSVKH